MCVCVCVCVLGALWVYCRPSSLEKCELLDNVRFQQLAAVAWSQERQ